MTKTSSAYAQAAFASANTHANLESWHKLLVALKPLRHSVYKNPLVSTDAILQVLQTELALSEDQQAWLKLMHKHQHLHLLPRVCEKFITLYENSTAKHPTIVTTARELSSDEKQNITTQLSSQGDVVFIIDPAIIGGICLDYKGQVIDHSFANFLNQLQTKT